MGKTIPLADRFWAKVQKSDTCWLWIGATDSDGYGGIRLSRTTMAKAHRVAYELVVGPIPDGLEIDHLCRVRNCVNPRASNRPGELTPRAERHSTERSQDALPPGSPAAHREEPRAHAPVQCLSA